VEGINTTFDQENAIELDPRTSLFKVAGNRNAAHPVMANAELRT